MSDPLEPVPTPPGPKSARALALRRWAARVHITIEPFDPDDSISDIRHKKSNYMEIVEAINQAPSGYTFSMRQEAYWIVKRRVNALAARRLENVHQTSHNTPGGSHEPTEQAHNG